MPFKLMIDKVMKLCNIHVCLVSEQTVPNILGIHHFKPDSLLFITTDEMDRKRKVDAIMNTMQELGLNYKGKSNKLVVQEDSKRKSRHGIYEEVATTTRHRIFKRVVLKVENVTIDLSTFYTVNAKLFELDEYIYKAKALAGEGNDIILTGQSPVWLYLKIAHALHGKARKLIYRSPVTGAVVIFDHSPD